MLLCLFKRVALLLRFHVGVKHRLLNMQKEQKIGVKYDESVMRLAFLRLSNKQKKLRHSAQRKQSLKVTQHYCHICEKYRINEIFLKSQPFCLHFL